MSDRQMMNDIVDEARVDWIDMGHAIGIVSAAEGGEHDLAILRRAGALVARLVHEGQLVPGDIGTTPGEFVPWALSPTESARYLEEYVDRVASGQEPFEPWQPCMFAATDSV